MENLPLIKEFGCARDDNRAVFPLINRTGEELVLIPRDKFEVITQSGSSIILRALPEDGKMRGSVD